MEVALLEEVVVLVVILVVVASWLVAAVVAHNTYWEPADTWGVPQWHRPHSNRQHVELLVVQHLDNLVNVAPHNKDCDKD